MNANVLEALAEGAGVSPAVARTAASDLRKGERTEDGDVVRVVRGYTFAPLGRDLYEAGHLLWGAGRLRLVGTRLNGINRTGGWRSKGWEGSMMTWWHSLGRAWR